LCRWTGVRSAPSGQLRMAGAISRVAGLPVAGVLASLAWLRGGKAVHPHGVTYSATFCADGASVAPTGSCLLRERAERSAIVRFSRSVGLPRPLPDLLGVSIRVLNAYGDGRHQDFLMVSSVDLPLLHHVFLPATDVQQRPYSSSLPYRAGARTFLVGVRAAPDSPRPSGGNEFDRLARAAESGRLRFDFLIASLLGRFERVGEVQIESRLPDEVDALRFNPFTTGADLEPVGTLNRWRRDAYPLSQRAWGARENRALAQDRAADLVGTLAERERMSSLSSTRHGVG
jgi:hypothetical protein